MQLYNCTSINAIISLELPFQQVVILSSTPKKGKFRFKPISAFVDIFALGRLECLKMRNVNRRNEKILLHANASVNMGYLLFISKIERLKYNMNIF